MDGILLEIHNRKERCYTLILSAATSHIQTWSHCYSRGTTDTIITLFVWCSDTSWLLVHIPMHPPAFLLVNCAYGIASHALKLISAPTFPPSEDVPL
jgi:hypothetical protein